MGLENGKRYLIVKEQEKNLYVYRIAYWFKKRMKQIGYHQWHTCEDGFYHNQYYYFPHKNVLDWIDMDRIPPFTSWKNEVPIEGEKYLVYRIGISGRNTPHYTIRKFHNGNFGSKDVKYWIRLFDLF